MTPESVSNEDALIGRLVGRIRNLAPPPSGPGDDAALVEITADQTLFCIDTLVEGVHFDLAVSDYADAGYKAVAVNVSDIAAMGGRPIAGVVSMTIPEDFDADRVDAIYSGIEEAAGQFFVQIVGGDMTRGGSLSLTVALLGSPSPSGSLLRAGSEAGDVIGVTGELGAAALGLEIARLGGDRDHPWVQRHRRPVPRLTEGESLASAGASGAIDVSDGLLLDLARLCRASGVGAEIESGQIPLAASADPTPAVITERERLEAALGGGDDYELCFTIAPGAVDALNATWPQGSVWRPIGEIVDGGGVLLDHEPVAARGWDHFVTKISDDCPE